MKSKGLMWISAIATFGVLAVSVGAAPQAKGPSPAAYTVTDIGTLGGTYSFAYSINDSGMVAGGAATASQSDPAMVAQTAFYWAGGQPISLGNLGGTVCPACNSEGSAVSASGMAALLSETATSYGSQGEDFCEFGNHRQCLAAVWRNGTLTALPTLPGGNNSAVFFVNSMGEAVGVSEIASTDADCATPFQTHRFVAAKWSPKGMVTALAPLPGDTVSFAFMNNNVGEAVGMSGQCSNVVLPPFAPGSPIAPHAVFWDASGTPHDLGNPPGSVGVYNVASGMNDQGQVAINSIMSDGTVHAFLWSDGAARDLGTYPAGAPVTFIPCCNNVNDRGQIAGASVDGDGNLRALLWPDADETPIDLNALIPADSAWYILLPGGINAAGEIAATAVNLNTFEVHAVLVSPIAGIGPMARGAMKPPAVPQKLKDLLLRQFHGGKH